MVLELLFEFRFHLAAPPFAQLVGQLSYEREGGPELAYPVVGVAVRGPDAGQVGIASRSVGYHEPDVQPPPSRACSSIERSCVARHLPTGDKQFLDQLDQQSGSSAVAVGGGTWSRRSGLNRGPADYEKPSGAEQQNLLARNVLNPGESSAFDRTVAHGTCCFRDQAVTNAAPFGVARPARLAGQPRLR